MSSEVKISPQLDYKAKASSHPTYQFQRVLAQNGQNVPISQTAGNLEAVFEIPANKAINLAESVLSWQFDCSGGGAGAYNWIYGDTFGEVNKIELLTQQGTRLVEIEDANVYMQMIRPKETKLVDMLSMEPSDGLYSSNEAYNENYRPTAAASFGKSFLDRGYLITNPAANTGSSLPRRMKLGYLLNSFLSYNKDVLFPQIVTLRVLFNGNRVGFTSTAVANPTTTPGALSYTNIANPVNKLQLYLAVEQNLDIINDLRAKIMTQGMSVPVNFVTRSKISLQGNSHNVTLRVSNNLGKTLQKVIHGVYNNSEILNTMYDHNNWESDTVAQKVKSYYVQLDSTKLTQFDIECAPNIADDYMLHRKRLVGSAIPSKFSYHFSWFHEEDFTNSGSPSDKDSHDDNIIAGLDLSVEKRIDFVANIANALVGTQLQHYDFIITQKALSITPNLITFA